MSAVLAPFGMRPAFHPTGLDRAIALPAGIASAYATNIYKGDPVLMLANNGVLNAAAVNQDFQGAFAGCEFDDTSGRRRVSNYWPTGTTFAVGGTVIAYYYDDPLIVYEIQAPGALAQTSIGNQADFANLTVGSAVTGISQAEIATALKGSGVSGQLRILGLAPYFDNAWGDAFTIVRVMIARHQYYGVRNAI